MNSCVNKNKEFYSLAEEHGIDGNELELIVHKYWNEVGKEDSFPPSSYINEQLGIGKSYDETSENVRKLWERDYSRPIKFKSEYELNGAVQKAKTFFPADTITTYKDSNSNYILRIAEPIHPALIEQFKSYEEFITFQKNEEIIAFAEIEDILAKAPRDAEGRLLAPNGKVSNLTERQYTQVRTKAFKRWFGDWENDPANASKVVDENGEPLVTWHSTLAEIENNIFKDYENITISRNEEWFTDKNIYDYKKEGYIITNNDILEYNKGNKITIKRPNGIYSSSERDVSNTYTKKEYEAFDEYDQYTDWNADHKAEQWSLEEEALYDKFKKEVENNVPEEYKAYNIGIDAYKEYIIEETEKRVEEEMSKRHPQGKQEFISPTNPYNYSDNILGSEFALFNSIKNPLIIDANYSNWNEIEYNNEIHSTRSLEKYARDNGYDGIIVKNVYDVGGFARKEGIKSSTIIASFNSNQVKSATDNIGTFSTIDDNILYDITSHNTASSSHISYIGQKEATARVQSFIDSIDKSGEYGQAIQEFIDTFGTPVINEVIFNITQANTHNSSWNNFTRALKLGFSEMASSEEKAAVTLHELIHSRTTSLANLYERAHGVKSLKPKEKSKVFESLPSEALTPEIEKAFDNIVECKAEVLKYLEENPEIKGALLSTDVTTNLNKRPLYAILKETNKYGVKEFISEIYTNPAFIQLLKSIPTKVKKQSLWDKFVNALRSIFGKKKAYISVLDRARENADVIVRAGNNVNASFETISEDASSLPIGQQRSQLRNYYASLQTRSSQEFKQVKALASQAFRSQHTFTSESAAKAIADNYIRDNHIDSDMVAYTYGYKVPNQQFFVPVIKWKSDTEYANAKYVSAGNYVNSLTNSEVESEVLRLSTDEEMFDSTFTFNDGTTIDTPFELNDQQKIALQKIDDFANDKSKTAITLSGYAGTGKTSLMEMVAKKLGRNYNVVFSATTHQAAGVLKSKVGKYGFETKTVNSLFGINISTDLTGKNYDTRKKVRNYGDDKLQYGDIVIIDEASMLSDENYNDVVAIAKMKNAKVIFVGDKAQLAPVGQNEVSKAFRDANGEVVELTKVERTGDNAILSEATSIRNGQNFTYESAFNAQGQGVAYVTPQSTDIISSIIETFTPGLKTNPNYLRILAFTNAAVASYNSKVRQSLGYNGLAPQVGEPMLGYANWGYDRLGAAVGAPFRFVNSCSYKVVATQASYKSGVRLSDGTVCSFDILPLRLEGSMGEQITVPFIDIKNNIQNRNSAKLVAQEKEVLRVKALSAKGIQKAKLWDAINDLENFLFVNDEIIGSQNNHLQDKVIDFGYAHTIHKSQGGTYTHVIMDDGGIESSRSSAEMKQQLKYVGVSRATDTVTIISPQTKKADSPVNHMQVGPEEVNNSNIAPTRPETENIINFNDQADLFSTWIERPFIHRFNNGYEMQFKTVSQAYYYTMALVASDLNIAQKILKAETPNEMVRLASGLNIKGTAFDKSKLAFFKTFIKESYQQNPKDLKSLVNTGNATIVRKGANTVEAIALPDILMQVRDELRNYQVQESPMIKGIKEQFAEYFQIDSNIKKLKEDYPGLSQDIIDKFVDYLDGEEDFTEADAKRFLEEAKNKPTLKEIKPTITEFKNSPKPEANNTQEQRAPEVFNDNKTSVNVVSSNKTILSNEELQQWNEAGLGEKPRILVASEHTDPVFHVNKILDILEGKSSVNEWGIVNGKRQVVGKVSGKDFAGLYLVTKHDGLPMKRILETKIPKLIHFSITSLGGTKYEPGVMKANDLLDRIGEYIKQGLDPKSVTIRIDPIVPGVTTKEGIENIVKRASEMGIRRIRFSIMDAYPNTQLAMEKLGYDFSQYYTRKADGKYNFFANTSYIDDICNFMLSLKDKYDVTLGTCAEAIAKNGISKEGCLSVSSVNEMLGTSIEDKGTANNEQRKLCSCYGGKIDALQYNSNCASHCVYCYAKHENDTAMQYYNEDGTLKDNDFTRTLEEAKNKPAASTIERKTYTGMINSLQDNQIFVFGSNTQGRHGAGAAKTAKNKFGAIYGQAEGIQGNSFAIITKDLTKDDRKHPSRTQEQIKEQIQKLYDYANAHPEKEFVVAYSAQGRNLNYYTNEQMAEMFATASSSIPSNIVFEEGFSKLVFGEQVTSTSTPLQDPRVSLAEHTPSQQGTTNMLPPVNPSDVDTTTPKNQIPAPNPEGPLKGFTLHSGGAIGADFAWGNIGASYGVSGKHYFDATDAREGKRPPYSNTPITDEERTLGERKAFHAGKQMGRLSSKAQKITDPLLIRDWLQVQNSDMVVAIAQKFDMPGDKFSNRADDERKALIPQVSGGTGWAVQMAINEGIPVFIFSQEDKTWRLIDNFGVWHYAEAPVLSMNFTGIGTRGLNADGEAAIRECYEKTVASLNSQTAIPTVEDIVEQAKKPFDIDSLPENMIEDFKRQIARDQQINNILSSKEMTSIEAREIVDSLMNRLSDYISEIINDPSLANTALKESDYNAWLNTLLVAQTRGIQEVVKPFDPTGMSRLDIINKIGIDNLVQQFLGKEVLTAKRTTTRPQAKKMRVLSHNLDALLYLGANTLSINEGIHITTTRVNGKEMKTMEEGVVINSDLNSARDLESMQENEGSLQEKWQVDSRTIDVVESMSQLVRNELFKLYQLDSNGNKITDGIGIYKRVPVQETTKQLLSWLQGCLTLPDVVARLKDKQASNPWVKQLIDVLDVEALGENAGQYTDFQNSFFSVFNKHFQSYSATTITYDKDGVQHIKRISLNEKPFLKETLGQIKVNIESGIHPLFTAKNGVNQLAFENFKTVLDTLHTIRDTKKDFDKISGADRQLAFEAISQAASLLGYPTDATTLDNLLNGREIGEMITNLDNMYDDILANVNNPNYEPLTFTKGKDGKKDSGIRGSLSKFLEPLTKHLADISVSAIFDSGKTYQSHVTPSYMTKLMLKFHETDPVKFDQFIQEEFGKYDWFRDTSIRDPKAGWKSGWIGRLARNAADRKIFKHEVKLNYNKHNYMKNMTGNEYIMSLLSSFFSEGAGTGKEEVMAWYRIPILSNKPSEEYIRFYADMGQDYKEVISTKMAKVFNQELSRIQTVRMQNYDKSDPRFIKNFHENGKRFCFLDFMNVYLEGGTEANTELGKLLNAKLEGTNWDVANEPRLLDLAKGAIQANMQTRISEILKDYENRGIMEIAENIDGIKQGFGKDNIAENIERFLWNDSYAATQILQLTVTDIAYYQDMEDLQKRIAQIHAPGVRGNAEAVDYEGNRVSDGIERTMYLTDFDGVKSNIIDNVKIVFDRKLEELRNQPLDNFSNTKLKTDEDIQRATEAKKQRIMIQEELYNSILKQFEDINVADAQGYSSPTSYRKKMFIFGKWSREAENIYQKLLTGDYNYHDLQVAFQPLKPFVYSQIEKPTYLEKGPLKSFKMPVQNKNSEYLLIMADAILQGENTGQPNLLRAIYEVMEESAKASPTKGIDTIQFESTVKSGLMGRNDINRVLEGGKWNELIETKDPNTGKIVQRTRGEVAAKAYLQNNLYIKNEQGVVTGYNPTYVHEIPFEDYCIQQEVPIHFKDHDQQHGSQIRMITPSDLLSVDTYGNPVTYNVEGRELSAKEFREEYEQTIADNIQQSINELVKELHLDAANQVEKNIILSRMLQDEILSSPRYGLDMYLACSLDPVTGEFRIPLGDPIQANRIEQLLNSIIKKRVNEQKIAGGPVVQVSNFGTSRRLNIRFKDRNGGLLKTRDEFTKSWKPDESADKMDVKSLANKLMKEEKLSYMTAIKEAKRRIEESQNAPKQTANEAYEKYIKNNQGGIAYFEVFAPIFNDDIFHRFANPDGTIDIAAMEKVCPEALQMIGYRIPTEDKYSCAPIKIVGFLPREAGEGIMLPYDITLLTGSDFDVDKEYLMRKQIHIKPKPFHETFEILFPEFLEAKKKESKLTRDFTDQEKRGLKRDFTEMLNTFIGTEKIDDEVMYDVHNYQREAMTSAIEKKMWDRFKLVGYKVSKADKGKLYRDNKIFDMTWEVLSHETTADKMLNPGGFEEQKFESYLIEAFRNGTYSWKEYNDLGKKKLQLKDGKLEPYNEQDIKDKKASTGIAALKKLSYNTKNLIFSDSQVQFYEQNNAASTILGMFAVQKIGHAVLESNGYQIDVEEACDIAEPFTLLGKVFGGKMEFDPMLDDEGNVIGKTLGSHVAAAADAAKEPCMNLLNINSMTANVHSTLIRLGMPFRHASLFLAQPVIRELLDRYNKRNLTDFASLDTILNEYIQEFREEGNMADSSIEHEEITEQELIDNLRDNKPETNYKVAVTFGKLQRLAYAIKGPTYLTRYNSISNAVGPLITDNIVTEYKTNYSTTGLYDRNGNELVPEIVFADHPILRKFADAYELANKIFEDFPTKSQAFSEVLKSIPGSLQDRFLNDRELLNDLKDFFLSHALIDNRVVNENRAGYYIKEFARDFVVNGIQEKNLDSEFIQAIKVKQDKDTGELSLELSTTGMDQKKKDRLSDSWYELYKKNQSLAMDLFNYCFFRGGIGFNPKTFMNLLPLQMREEIPGYKESFTNIPTESAKYILEQFLAHNTSNHKLFPIKEGEKDVIGGGIIIQDKNELSQYADTPAFRIKDSNGKWRYLLLDKVTDDGLAYKEIIPLGNNGEYLEMSSTRVPNISIREIYGTNRSAKNPKAPKKQNAPEQKEVTNHNNRPMDDTNRGLVTQTPAQEKSKAERIIQGIMNSGLGMRTPELAKKYLKNNAIINAEGKVEISNPTVWKYISAAMEAQGLKANKEELLDVLQQLC